MRIQHNAYDCGPYILEYAESFLQNYKQCIKKINNFEDLLDLIPYSVVKSKRKKIYFLILSLCQHGSNFGTVVKDFKLEKEKQIEEAVGQVGEYETFDVDGFE